MAKIRFKLVGSSRPHKTWNATGFNYMSKEWLKLRSYYLQSNPICVECEKNGHITAAKVVDHIIPIRFGGAHYDADNLQSLCESCHNSKSAIEAKMNKAKPQTPKY